MSVQIDDVDRFIHFLHEAYEHGYHRGNTALVGGASQSDIEEGFREFLEVIEEGNHE